ncbi:Gfo/Idh/MocA family protein [Gracilibacillus boraciitolerans]
MAEAAEEAMKKGIVSMCAYQYRRVPAVVLAKKFIDEGSIGDILNVRATYLQSWSADPSSPLSWRFQKGVAGAGALGDIATHVIDISQYLAGDIKEVVSSVQTYIKERPVQEGGVDLLGTVKIDENAQKEPVDVDDEASFLVKFKNGAVGSIEATRNAWGKKQLYYS